MAVEQFTKANLRTIDAEIQSAVQEVATKHGITITVGGGSYTASDATVKLSLKVEGADEQNFEKYAPLVGLEASDLGREFTYAGKTYKITGINLRARSYPILATRGGKTYKFAVSMVKAGLAGLVSRNPHIPQNSAQADA